MGRILLAAALAATLLAADARADGLPVPGMVDVGPAGIALPGGDHRWVTLTTESGTVVQRIRADGGNVVRFRVLDRKLTLPAVAMDGSPGGLSANARTLVLIRSRVTFPQKRTHLAILDARTLKVRRHLNLRGDYSFDAISPNGRTAFLTHYISARDAMRYDVVPMNTRSGRIGAPIVDEREPGEKMQGYPYTRAASADGRWAYTLYGGGHEAFVHALDTRSGKAACIDLEALTDQDLSGFRLRVDGGGGSVSVLDTYGEPLNVIDARTFAVGEPEAPAPPRAAAPSVRPDDDGSFPWPLAAVIAALLAAAAFVAARVSGAASSRARSARS